MATLDLSARRLDLIWNRKDTRAYQLILEDEDGELYDFTGTTVVQTVNPMSDGSGSDLFTLSPVNTLANDGVLQFRPSAGNNDRAPGVYYHDIEWTFGGNVWTLFKGLWTIKEHISN